MKRLFTGLILLMSLVLMLAAYYVGAPEPERMAQLPGGSVHAASPARMATTPQATPSGAIYENDKRRPESNGGMILILVLFAVIVVALVVLSGRSNRR